MGLFSVFIGLFLLTISIIIYRKGPLHPVVFFFVMWTTVCAFSAFQKKMFAASDETYDLIIIMLICVFIGSLAYFFPALRLRNSDSDLEYSYENVSGNSKKTPLLLAYILLIIYVGISLIDSYIIVKNYLQGTELWVMRGWRMSTFGVDSNPLVDRQSFAEVIFRATILYPLQNLVAPISAYLFFNKSLRLKYKNFLFLAAFSFLLTIVATGGSRNTIVYYFGCFILYYLLSGEKSSHVKQQIKKTGTNFFVTSFILVVAIALVLFVTNARTNLSVWDSVSSYLGVAPTLLTIHLPEIQQIPPTYGMLSFFGLITYPMRFLQQIGLESVIPTTYFTAFQQVLNAQSFYVVSATGLVRNAYVTPIFYFLIDGGVPFLVVASLGFGAVLGRFSKNFFKKVTLKKFTYYSLVMQAILFSFVQVPTVQPSFVFSILLAWVLLGEKK